MLHKSYDKKMNIRLLELYSDYIISSFGQITATGLSRALSGSVRHDKITRFLSKEDLSSNLDINKKLITFTYLSDSQ